MNKYAGAPRTQVGCILKLINILMFVNFMKDLARNNKYMYVTLLLRCQNQYSHCDISPTGGGVLFFGELFSLPLL